MSMNRLTFRPRPLDIHKKLSIVRSIKELDSEDAGVSRTVHHGHIALDAENEEVLSAPAKKGGSEIPTPRFEVVESYTINYTPTFKQTASYIRSKPARCELIDYVEYDLDDEDDDWLESFNCDRKLLIPEKFEWILYKFEVMDFKLREKSGIAFLPYGVYTEICLTFEYAYDHMKNQNVKHGVLLAAYNYWKEKRERWGKPLLRRLQPAPSVNDTNPFHVFRPREKISRPNTRRMQRRENDYHSFEKLCQIRQNIQEAKELLFFLQKREEKKRSLAECELKIAKLELNLNNEPSSLKNEFFFLPPLPPLPSPSPSPLPPKPQLKTTSVDLHQFSPEKKKVNGFLTAEVKRKRSRESYNTFPVSNQMRESNQIKIDQFKNELKNDKMNDSSFLKENANDMHENEEDDFKGEEEEEGEEEGKEEDEEVMKNIQLRKKKRRRNLVPPKMNANLDSFTPVPNLFSSSRPSRPLPPSLPFSSFPTLSSLPRIASPLSPSPSPSPPFMPFTQPIDLTKLAGMGIHPLLETDKNVPCRARIGRGGRVVFDRYDCISQSPIRTFLSSSDNVQSLEVKKPIRRYKKNDSMLGNFRNPPPPRIHNVMEKYVQDAID